MKVGFVGLGLMGMAIARRLARSGFAVTGCDRTEAHASQFDEPGSTWTTDPLAAATGAAMLGVCVRDDAQLEAITADGRLFAAMAPGGLFLLHSTVAPDLARRLGAEAARAGIGFIDAGVSGGPDYAIAGRLSLFVGADPADFERARPWLDAIGHAFHLGPVGRGQEGKLLNNLISIANYGAAFAILDMAADLGIDTKVLTEAFQTGSGQSYAIAIAPRLYAVDGVDGERAAQIQGLHDLLTKDLGHGLALPVDEPAARATIAAAGEAMLARMRRSVAEAGGQPAPRDANALATAYFAAVRGRDMAALLALFADDATLVFPNGTRFEGLDAIGANYAATFANGWPTPTPGYRFTGPDGVAVEVDVIAPSGAPAKALSIFRCNRAGRITSLTVYPRA